MGSKTFTEFAGCVEHMTSIPIICPMHFAVSMQTWGKLSCKLATVIMLIPTSCRAIPCGRLLVWHGSISRRSSNCAAGSAFKRMMTRIKARLMFSD